MASIATPVPTKVSEDKAKELEEAAAARGKFAHFIFVFVALCFSFWNGLLFSKLEQKILKFEKEKEADAKRIADLEYALSIQVGLHRSEVAGLEKNMQRLKNEKESHITSEEARRAEEARETILHKKY
ncbi:hypothetical protein ACJX0J_030669, partial [Zea mays]